MSTQRTIDPEVHAILAEVVADSNSTFFGRPSIQIPDANPSRITARDTMLTRAERKLVSVHREELAHLLLERVDREVTLRLASEGARLRYHSSTRVVQDPPTYESCRGRSSTASAGLPESLEEVDSVVSVAATALEAPTAEYSSTSIASLSLRLVPRDATKIFLAHTLFEEECQQSALSILSSVASSSPDSLIRSIAYQNIGMMHSKMGMAFAALKNFRAGTLTTCGRGDPAMLWFSDALFSGQEDQAHEASRLIDQYLSPTHESVSEFLDLTRFTSEGRSRRGLRREQLVSTFQKIENLLPKTAWRIGDALSSMV